MMKNYPRFIFERASPRDSNELLTILEDSDFPGNISLMYTRRPDAYRSFKQEAQEVDIVVARDRYHGSIAGFGACAKRTLFVNGRATTVGYLFGLRVARDYIGKYPFFHRGYVYLHTLHAAQDISCYMTTILEENLAVQKLLEKPRKFMPTYQPFGTYNIFALKTAQAKRLRGNHISQTLSFGTVRFRRAHKGDISQLVQFLHTQGKAYQFFPVIQAEHLQSDNFLQLRVEDFCLLQTESGEIVAAGAPWDQGHYKQYIVQGYRGLLKGLYPLSRIFPLFGFPALPIPQSILRFFTVSFWAVKDHNPEIFPIFLDEMAKISGDYPFFLIGLHERHPLRHYLQKRPHISYNSKIYLVFWPEQAEYVQDLDREILPYLECGML